MKFIFSLLVAVVFGSLSCSATDLDSVDYYDLDPVPLSPMTASALDYGIALAAAADWSTTDSSNLASIEDSLTNTASNITVAGMLYDIVDYVEYMPNMNTQLNLISGYLHGVSSNNLADDVYWIRRGISDLSSVTVSLQGTIASIYNNLNEYNPRMTTYLDYLSSYFCLQLWSFPLVDLDGNIVGSYENKFFSNFFEYFINASYDGLNYESRDRTLYSRLKQLQEVLASDDDKVLAESQKANREEIENTFLTGSSSSTSLGVSDFGDLADVGGTIKDSLSLDGNATIGSFTSGLAAADSAGQGWFSEETRSQLDAVSSTVTYSLRDPDPYNMAGWEDRYYWLLGDDD